MHIRKEALMLVVILDGCQQPKPAPAPIPLPVPAVVGRPHGTNPPPPVYHCLLFLAPHTTNVYANYYLQWSSNMVNWRDVDTNFINNVNCDTNLHNTNIVLTNGVGFYRVKWQ